MSWVKSVGGFVGFGLKGFVICGFQTQWAPWYFFFFFKDYLLLALGYDYNYKGRSRKINKYIKYLGGEKEFWIEYQISILLIKHGENTTANR